MKIQILASPSKLGIYLSGVLLFMFHGACKPPDKIVINSLGIKLIRVPSGSFKMGESISTPPHRFGQPEYQLQGDWDEHLVHEVKLINAFYISETEITMDQFCIFNPDFQGNQNFDGYVSGIIWYEAEAFCNWLNEKEGRVYCLPTEDEWECACRAGSSGLFSSGRSFIKKVSLLNRLKKGHVHEAYDFFNT